MHSRARRGVVAVTRFLVQFKVQTTKTKVALLRCEWKEERRMDGLTRSINSSAAQIRSGLSG